MPDPPDPNTVPLADALSTLRALTSFSSMTRIYPSPLATSALSETTIAKTTIVLAPLNSAIEALPRKPWEDPDDYAAFGDSAYEGPQGRRRADENLRRFVDRHVVVVEAADAWPPGRRAKSLAGCELWWQQHETGNRLVMPHHVEVERVASRVAAGEIVSSRRPLPPLSGADPPP